MAFVHEKTVVTSEQHLDSFVGPCLGVIAVAFGVVEVARSQDLTFDHQRTTDHVALLGPRVAMSGKSGAWLALEQQRCPVPRPVECEDLHPNTRYGALDPCPVGGGDRVVGRRGNFGQQRVTNRG